MASHYTWLLEVLQELTEQGWQCRWGTKHVIVYPKDRTKKCFTISTSPSNAHAHNMVRRQIRNTGGNIHNIKL